MPSQTIDEMTGQDPSTARAAMRVTSARSRGVSENTSPVWPLVIMPTTPGCAASQRANEVSSCSSMEKSGRNGTAIAGMRPWKFVIVGM